MYVVFYIADAETACQSDGWIQTQQEQKSLADF